jgi:predicted esterase
MARRRSRHTPEATIAAVGNASIILPPFRDDQSASLDGSPVLIIDGEKDGRRLPLDGARLAQRLTRAGGMVSHHVLPVGHSITALGSRYREGVAPSANVITVCSRDGK